jgi:hypothetical protein
MTKYMKMEINMDRNGHVVRKWTKYIALIIGQN